MWSAVQEPDYEVVRKLGDIEVRKYAAYTVAEILVAGSVEEAANWAFPILAGYIFGKNKGDRTLAMTTPVAQAVAPLQFAMTAPVTQTPAPGGFVVQFVLPKGVTVDSAPEPTDPRVQLREMPARTIAAIRYTGFWSPSNYTEHLATLMAALKAVALRWSGEPAFSRYNAPWTPWFLRRNEIWLSLQ
ncbi:MAG TPA: heme-binding protein [Burkholderiaceae bacterium]